jgi:O-methyltransferase
MGRKLTLANLNKLVRHPGRYLARVRPVLANPRGFYLQSEMEISPRSVWHNREFASATGGFLIPADRVERRICNIGSWDQVRRDMLILQMRSVLIRRIEGDFAELGVWQGFSARLIHQYAPDRRLHLFDTFCGFDPRDLDVKLPPELFADTTVETVLKRISPRNDNVVVHRGRFPDTATEAAGKFAFVHLDADMFQPTTAGLEYFYPRMSKGSVIVVHDYNTWMGARQAVDQFFALRPEVPLAMPDRCGSVVIVKA